MTLTELAKLAHVSTSTASKAFALSSEVNAETREMIFEVAKQHGCFKKFYRLEYPGLVFAVICPEFESTYYSAFISEMQKCLAKYNSETTVAATGFSIEAERRHLEYYQRYNTVDGIILIDGRTDINPKCEIPVATVNHRAECKGAINVIKGMRLPIYQTVENWVKAGVRDIGFIGDPCTNGRRNRAYDAIQNYLGEVNTDYFVRSDARFERGGYLGALELMDREKLPRAVICAYDRRAIGAMRAFSDRGLKIPDDIAMIGIDNAPASSYSIPSLSSIDHRLEDTCKTLAEALIAKIKGESFQSDIEVFCRLIERESSQIKS